MRLFFACGYNRAESSGLLRGRTYGPRPSDEPCLLAAIDTSLSMTLPELEEVVRHLALVNERARLVVAACDVEVTRVCPFSGTIERVSGP